MQGLENVDVPGLVILATGAGILGTMLLAGIGWRKRDREALERLHAATTAVSAPVLEPEPVLEPAPTLEIPIDLGPEPEETSGTRILSEATELLEPDDDDVTPPVLYTSADLALAGGKLDTVHPVMKRSGSDRPARKGSVA